MFAERLAFELQTYFRSSLLSLRNFRRERSDNPKYVCSPQATERSNRAEYNWYVICKKLGVIRWLDCPCEIIWKLHFNCPNNSCLLFFLPPAFLFLSFLIYAFFLFSLPLARLVISGGQNVSVLVSLQNFPAIDLNSPSYRRFLCISVQEILSYFP